MSSDGRQHGPIACVISRYSLCMLVMYYHLTRTIIRLKCLQFLESYFYVNTPDVSSEPLLNFKKKRQSISKSRHRVKCECGFIHKHRLGAFHLCEIGWIFYKLIQARGTVCCHCLWVFQWRRSICQGGTMVMYQLFTKQSGYNSTTLLNRLVCLSSKGTSFT